MSTVHQVWVMHISGGAGGGENQRQQHLRGHLHPGDGLLTDLRLVDAPKTNLVEIIKP